ncbi:MAG: UDP-N-acetylmuramoylalanyl-D-glutamate--L-ornithine ligase [uncultured Thermomicrobiales bacterium]|uniref:UDP-N-acetylmuramyl-tripeptide synthetase n=1 Tax=uncultured Thermomicrobiales bacterium TaxID=1645740 RepID=A0A6J4VJ19_9BACT|nr:MAG: UDP-N-acetylmuramoylalanyl-D-glutamate--L-ornithine ligase [uncultured Thermomicrobiales bacterium]
MPSVATSVSSLAAAVSERRLVGDGSALVRGIAYDSRLVEPGFLFAALPGAHADGHEFAASAVDRGAAALLVERELPLATTQIVVPDSRAALAAVATAFYRDPSRELGVIGITGTDGKTTVSFLVDAILRAAGLATGLIGTVAIRVGDDEDFHTTRQTTPESADIQRLFRRMVDRGIDWATVEATSHGLAMHRLDGTRFRAGAVTNVTREHLDYHGSVEHYRRAKGILFERVAAAGGTVVVNLDDPGARGMVEFAGDADVLTYSIEDHHADLSAVGIVSTGGGSSFTLVCRGRGTAAVDLPLIGGFNIANALCAAGVGLAVGLDLAVIAAGLGNAPAVPGRMALVQEGQPFAVVVDYAHTPEAMANVLPLLRRLFPLGRLIVVFGSAGERDVEKRPRQGEVAARLADLAVVTSEDPRYEDPDAIIDQITRGAIAAGAREGESLFRFTDRREAVRHALRTAAPGDCVLLAGKGHEESIIWSGEKRPWNEAGVARALLRELGYRTER